MTNLELSLTIFTHYKNQETYKVSGQVIPVGDIEHGYVTVRNRDVEDLTYEISVEDNMVSYSLRHYFQDNYAFSRESVDKFIGAFLRNPGPFKKSEVNKKWIEISGKCSVDKIEEKLLTEIDNYITSNDLFKDIKEERTLIQMIDDLKEKYKENQDLIDEIDQIKEQYELEQDDSEQVLEEMSKVMCFYAEQFEADSMIANRLLGFNKYRFSEYLNFLLSINYLEINDNRDYQLADNSKAKKVRELFLHGQKEDIKNMLRKEIF